MRRLLNLLLWLVTFRWLVRSHDEKREDGLRALRASLKASIPLGSRRISALPEDLNRATPESAQETIDEVQGLLTQAAKLQSGDHINEGNRLLSESRHFLGLGYVMHAQHYAVRAYLATFGM